MTANGCNSCTTVSTKLNILGYFMLSVSKSYSFVSSFPWPLGLWHFGFILNLTAELCWTVVYFLGLTLAARVKDISACKTSTTCISCCKKNQHTEIAKGEKKYWVPWNYTEWQQQNTDPSGYFKQCVWQFTGSNSANLDKRQKYFLSLLNKTPANQNSTLINLVSESGSNLHTTYTAYWPLKKWERPHTSYQISPHRSSVSMAYICD